MNDFEKMIKEECIKRQSYFKKEMTLSELVNTCLLLWAEDCFVDVRFLTDGSVTVRSFCKYGESYYGYYIDKDGNITKKPEGCVEYVDISLKKFLKENIDKCKIEMTSEGLLISL